MERSERRVFLVETSSFQVPGWEQGNDVTSSTQGQCSHVSLWAGRARLGSREWYETRSQTKSIMSDLSEA